VPCTQASPKHRLRAPEQRGASVPGGRWGEKRKKLDHLLYFSDDSGMHSLSI